MLHLSDHSISDQLQLVVRLLRTELAEMLLKQNIYAGQDKVILTLSRLNGQTPSGMAEDLGVKPPTITKTINRLESQGYLERKSSQTDGRSSKVFLTEKGHEIVKDIERSLSNLENKAFTGIDDQSRNDLIQILSKIVSNLKKNKA